MYIQILEMMSFSAVEETSREILTSMKTNHMSKVFSITFRCNFVLEFLPGQYSGQCAQPIKVRELNWLEHDQIGLQRVNDCCGC